MMNGTQGIPDDLLVSESLPLDVVGALDAIYRRMMMLDEESARIRKELLRVMHAVERRGG